MTYLPATADRTTWGRLVAVAAFAVLGGWLVVYLSIILERPEGVLVPESLLYGVVWSTLPALAVCPRRSRLGAALASWLGTCGIATVMLFLIAQGSGPSTAGLGVGLMLAAVAAGLLWAAHGWHPAAAWALGAASIVLYLSRGAAFARALDHYREVQLAPTLSALTRAVRSPLGPEITVRKHSGYAHRAGAAENGSTFETLATLSGRGQVDIRFEFESSAPTSAVRLAINYLAPDATQGARWDTWRDGITRLAAKLEGNPTRGPDGLTGQAWMRFDSAESLRRALLAVGGSP